MSMTQLLKGAFTLLVCAVAIVFCSQLWRAYVLAPWTRDGRVSAQVIRIAPQVSGQVSELQVIDNQVVHKGDLLYRIDSQAYLLARQQREAELVEAREIISSARINSFDAIAWATRLPGRRSTMPAAIWPSPRPG